MLVAYVLIVFVIVNEVVRRFVLSYSSLWGEEIARYAFVFLGWVGASYAVKQRAHIRFDTILNLLPRRFHGYVFLFRRFRLRSCLPASRSIGRPIRSARCSSSMPRHPRCGFPNPGSNWPCRSGFR
jgi:hypothetical protein